MIHERNCNPLSKSVHGKARALTLSVAMSAETYIEVCLYWPSSQNLSMPLAAL